MKRLSLREVKMKIEVPIDGILARVRASNEELSVVKEILSYKEKVFTGRKSVTVRGGERRMVQQWETVKRSALRGNSFLAGLVPRVQSGLKKKGISCVVEGVGSFIPVYKPRLHGMELRDYQVDVVRDVIKKRRGLVVFPTGSGKTVMMAAVISAYRSLSFLVIVQKIDLLNQTVKKLSDMLGEKVGCVSGKEERWCPVTVATIQTLHSRGMHLNGIGGLIVDEVHHAGSPTYRTVLGGIGAEVRIGFTATEAYMPSKQMQIEGLFGPVVASMPYEELSNDGLLARGTVYVYETPIDVDIYTLSASNWNNLYERGIVNNLKRNARIAFLASHYVKGGKKVLVIVNRISHGHLLCSMMGSEAYFVFGGSEMEDRNKVASVLNDPANRDKAVITTNIFDEGMDFPSLDVVIMARGWKSPIATIQSAGRGTRVVEGKGTFTVIDFYDRMHRVLKKHSNDRMKAYRSKGWNIIMKKDINEAFCGSHV
jgi:superfamily II DNA or RNA helicase